MSLLKARYCEFSTITSVGHASLLQVIFREKPAIWKEILLNSLVQGLQDPRYRYLQKQYIEMISC